MWSNSSVSSARSSAKSRAGMLIHIVLDNYSAHKPTEMLRERGCCFLSVIRAGFLLAQCGRELLLRETKRDVAIDVKQPSWTSREGSALAEPVRTG
jgi:hypothetical protein